jgi:hypothetical protein
LRRHHVPDNPNLTRWPGFGWLWGKMRRDKKRWLMFMYMLNLSREDVCDLIDHPEKFRDAVYEFLKTQEAK